MSILERLRAGNPSVGLFGLEEGALAPYGASVPGDWSALVAALEASVAIPAEGVAYVTSHPPLEATGDARILAAVHMGGMPIQVGYCAGRNSTLNGLEYHKCSEIVVAADDLVLLLGLRGDLSEEVPEPGSGETLPPGPGIDSSKVVGLVLLCGQAVELFSGTLHLAPCRVHAGGFRSAIILASGTNLEFGPGERPAGDPLLRKRNKWIIAHPQRRVLVDQGVIPTLRGPNRQVMPLEGA
ncbi:MAG: DUF4867 family protein [Rectinemataceae bacterium]